jgi:signal peptidase II
MQAPGGAEVARRTLLALVCGILALDQATKHLVVANIARGDSVPIVGDVLRITHLRNPGAAFGILRGFGGLLALVAVVGVGIFVMILLQKPPKWIGIGASLVAGGAAGNLTDRLTRGPFGRGEVVDFVDFSFWPTFNVADSAITIGAIMLVLSGFLHDEKADAESAEGS